MGLALALDHEQVCKGQVPGKSLQNPTEIGTRQLSQFLESSGSSSSFFWFWPQKTLYLKGSGFKKLF